jgi:hypothetical protein
MQLNFFKSVSYDFCVASVPLSRSDCFATDMGMLQNLVSAYIEIDRITPKSTVACSSAAEAFVYLINYDYDHYHYRGSGTLTPNAHGVANWTDYMDYVQRQVILSPEFSVWDKHTSEIEILAQKALSVSQKVLLAHNAPDKRLPKELVNGIYARIRILKRWKVEYLDPIRARDDYKEWKIKQTTPTTHQSHCKLHAMWECVNGANVS